MRKNDQPILEDYASLLAEIKERIRAAQYDALRAVNKELVALYWDLGRMIANVRTGASWGKAVVQRLATDLRVEFPGIRRILVPEPLVHAAVLPRHHEGKQNSNHWLEKSVGRNTW